MVSGIAKVNLFLVHDIQTKIATISFFLSASLCKSKGNLSHLCSTSCLLLHYSSILFFHISLLLNSIFHQFLALPNLHTYTQIKYFRLILLKNEFFMRNFFYLFLSGNLTETYPHDILEGI